MHLTRFEINPARRDARMMLASPQRMHAAVLAAFPESRDDGRILWRLDEGRHDVVLNVQGDLPTIDPRVLAACVAPLADPEQEDAGLHAATTMGAPGEPRTRPSHNGRPQPVPVPSPPSPPEAQVVGVPAEAPSRSTVPDRHEVLAQLRELYADTLEYPVDLMAEDALLEAELGVDSLKQTSLLGRVVERFALAVRPGDLPVWELATLGSVADYVVAEKASR